MKRLLCLLLFAMCAITGMDTKEHTLQQASPSTGVIVRVPAAVITMSRVQHYDPMKAEAEASLAAMTPEERLEFLRNLGRPHLGGPIKWWMR